LIRAVAATNPLNALTWIFAAFAIVVLVLFLTTMALAYWNKQRREEFEVQVQPRRVLQVSEEGPGRETEVEDVAQTVLLEDRSRVLTIGDLVMSPYLRERYSSHARRSPGGRQSQQRPTGPNEPLEDR